MKKQITLLLGLVLIGILGLAAGIEASKGNWDYRSLVRGQGAVHNVQVTAPTSLATKHVSFPAVSGCTPRDSAPSPFVRFVLERTESQAGVANDQAACAAAIDEEKTRANKISLCVGCPREDTTEVGLEDSHPQPSLPSSESVPADTETIHFIG